MLGPIDPELGRLNSRCRSRSPAGCNGVLLDLLQNRPVRVDHVYQVQRTVFSLVYRFVSDEQRVPEMHVRPSFDVCVGLEVADAFGFPDALGLGGTVWRARVEFAAADVDERGRCRIDQRQLHVQKGGQPQCPLANQVQQSGAVCLRVGGQNKFASCNRNVNFI